MLRELALAGALALGGAGSVYAGERVNTNAEGVAIGGYDTVAYFTEGAPTPGTPEYEHTWQDSTWRFATAEHRDLFAQDPRRYAPRFGGFCAGAVALGQMAPVDPEAWVIIDGKLYLNFAKADVPDFVDNADTYIADAERNWAELGPLN